MREEDPPPLPSSVTMSTLIFLSLLLFLSVVYPSRRNNNSVEMPTFCFVIPFTSRRIRLTHFTNIEWNATGRAPTGTYPTIFVRRILYLSTSFRGDEIAMEEWRKNVLLVAKITHRENLARIKLQQHLIYRRSWEVAEST